MYGILPKRILKTGFPILNSVLHAQKLGKVVYHVVFVPSSHWPSFFGGKQNRAAHRLGAGALTVFANSLSWKGVLERVSGTFILLAKARGVVSY